MKILSFANNTGSVQWRLQGPANYINSRTKHEMFVTSHKNWDEDILDADVVVAQMWQNPAGIDVCHEQGAKVVYEADDIIIGVGGKDRKELMHLSKIQQDQTKETIAKCDLVTVTTDVLAEHYRQFNDNVIVLPNYIDHFWWGEPFKVKSRGHIRLGWAGSTSHREDLLMIAPIIKEILDEFPFVKFIHCGAGGKIGLSGEDLFENIPPNRREHYKGVPLEYWGNKSKTLGFDIAIAPLLDDEFNAGKSPIKYFEYGMNAVPGVYSDTNVYSKTVKHGVTGFLAKNKEDWIRYISKLILDEEIRVKIAEDAFKDVVDNYTLDEHYKKWIKAYESIL